MAYGERIEAAFGRWGRWVYRHARIGLALSAVTVATFVSQLPKLTLDPSDQVFLSESDPVRLAYDRYRRHFGRDNTILIAIESDQIFTLPFLSRLRELHEELEREVPSLEDITSLINARHTYGSEDELIVEDLMVDWPEGPADVKNLEQTVQSNPLYRNYLISPSGRTTTITLDLNRYSSLRPEVDVLGGFEESKPSSEEPDALFLTPEEILASAARVRRVVPAYDAPDFRVHLVGGPIFNIVLLGGMQRDLVVFAGLALIGMIALLHVVFRRFAGVVLPILIVIAAVLCTVGAMALAHVPVTLPIQILPSLLLVIGICDAVHIQVIFFRSLDSGRSREDALAYALEHSGLAVVLTSVTTAAGLASLAGTELLPVIHFGIFGPIGVLFALLFSLTLLPALLAVVPLKPRRRTDRIRDRWMEQTFVRLGTGAARHPVPVLTLSGLLLFVALAGALRLEFSHNPLIWLPEDGPLRRGIEFVDREMEGGMSFEAKLETRQENGLHRPDVLRAIEDVKRDLEQGPAGVSPVGKMVSVVDILKETHQALNENRAEFYSIPDDRQLIAQELLLFENSGSDDLEDFVDSQFSVAGISLRIPWADGMELVPFLAHVESIFRSHLPQDVEVSMTGRGTMTARTFHAVIRSMSKSYVLAFLLVTPVMMLLLGSFRAGLISMLPNLTPLILTLGLMGILGYPLDFSTMMVGAIILGVAVDDTIHFMHGFRRYVRHGGTVEAVEKTLRSTGRALLFTTLVVAAGGVVYTFATMGNLRAFGFFTAFSVITAFLADVILAPALLSLFHRTARGELDDSLFRSHCVR